MDTHPENYNTTNDLEAQVHGVVEVMGASPAHMAMLLILATFPEDAPIGLGQFSHRLLMAQGHEYRQTSDLERAKCGHYASVLELNDLAKLSSWDTEDWQTRCATLTRKAHFIGTAVCGVLLPLESTAPQDNFLETALGPAREIHYARTESMYRRLLQGAASPVELGEICDLSQLHIGTYIRTLVKAGILTSQTSSGSSKKGPSLTIDTAYYSHIESLVQSISLLGANTPKAEAFRNKARQVGASIIRSAKLVSWLLAKDSSMDIFVMPPKPALASSGPKPEVKKVQPQLYRLTLDEQKVVPLLAQGFSNKEIGEMLSIGEVTAKLQIGAIIQKTGARNRAHAVALVYRTLSRQAAQQIADWTENLNMSPRQAGITKLLVAGYTNIMIAERLSISVNTVKTHVKTILRSLGARNRTQIVGLAHGIYRPPDQESEEFS